MRVTKTGSFETAHMLSHYEGKCHNLHGHSYHYEVSVTDDMKKHPDGMVVDFTDLKHIMEKFDHSVVFAAPNRRDPAETGLYEWACQHGVQYFELPEGRPTAETMAAYLAREIAQTFDPDQIVVRIWETDSGVAEYTLTRAPDENK